MRADAGRRRRVPVRVLAFAGIALVALAVIGMVWARSDGGGDAPTETEARAFLDRLVAAAMADDFDVLCALSGVDFNCRKQLGYAGEGSRPPEPPEVVDSSYYEGEFSDSVPGRLLVVEGTDGLGKPYRTEVLVFREGDHLEATNVVYWGNFEIYDRERTERRLKDRDPESIPDGERP